MKDLNNSLQLILFSNVILTGTLLTVLYLQKTTTLSFWQSANGNTSWFNFIIYLYFAF